MSTSSRVPAPIIGPYVSTTQLTNYRPGNSTPSFSTMSAGPASAVGFIGSRVTPPSIADFAQRLNVSPIVFSPAQIARRTIPGLVAQGQNGLSLAAKGVANLARSLGG